MLNNFGESITIARPIYREGVTLTIDLSFAGKLMKLTNDVAELSSPHSHCLPYVGLTLTHGQLMQFTLHNLDIFLSLY